jgi:3-demethoxyubiquinol 3-hydroxylase
MSKRLPGDPSTEQRTAQMIRVNHAGEYGAKRIYAGQLAVLGNTKSASIIAEMAEQEQVHLDAFTQMIIKRRVRPTLLMPLWHIGGFMMGAATALLGEKAAMACTVAVEKVIDEHYAAQEMQLADGDTELKAMVTQFRADEKEHHDTALAEGAQDAPLYPLLQNIISAQTKFAIWISSRV